MLGDGVVERVLKLRHLAAAEFEKKLRLPAGFRAVSFLAEALESPIGARTLAVERSSGLGIQRGDLTYQLFEAAVLATLMGSDRPEIDGW